MSDFLNELTEKEKETLRLIVRGHDAKSAAIELDLSVHTINERLRAARRKLDVTSSREAARMLLESEANAVGTTPENLVYEPLGDAGAPSTGEVNSVTAPRNRRVLWIGGIATMSLAAITLALVLASPMQSASTADAQTMEGSTQELDGLEDVARDWLAHIDAQDWQRGHAAGAPVFQQFITPEDFSTMIGETRNPLGAVVERRLDTFGSVSAPPTVYRLVSFITDFEDRKQVKETVTLELDDGVYKVSGYWIGEDARSVGNGTPVFADRDRELAARNWLELVDQGDWQASFDAAGRQFRDPNTVAGWQAASERARVPLGKMLTREVIEIEELNAPPAGYTVVKFRTAYANREEAVEIVTLEREGGEYRVVGYFIE